MELKNNEKIVYAGIIIGSAVVMFGVYKLMKSLKSKKLLKAINFKVERTTTQRSVQTGGYGSPIETKTIDVVKINSLGLAGTFDFEPKSFTSGTYTSKDLTKYQYKVSSTDNKIQVTLFANGSKIYSKTFTK